jgi:hypothetical protein
VEADEKSRPKPFEVSVHLSFTGAV